jgi:hypothetical protein
MIRHSKTTAPIRLPHSHVSTSAFLLFAPNALKLYLGLPWNIGLVPQQQACILVSYDSQTSPYLYAHMEDQLFLCHLKLGLPSFLLRSIGH